VVVREDGRIADRLTLFSSLNIDAARLSRAGDAERASAAAKAASEIEEGDLMTALVTLLRFMPRDTVRGFLRGQMPDQEQHPQFWGLTRQIAQQTAKVRAEFVPPPDTETIGVVSSASADEVLVSSAGGQRVHVPRAAASSLKLDHDGDLLAVHTEIAEDGRVIIDVLPAIELPGVDEVSFDPFARTAEPVLLPVDLYMNA
jgi:hypothetical protein